MRSPRPGLFITGTDTGVGKTAVTVAISRQLRNEGVRVGAYKPACSGAIHDHARLIWEDVEALHSAIGNHFERDRICPQRFRAAVAPPIAARAESTAVDANLLRQGALWWQDQCEFLLVEGAGGLLCPLTESESVADLAVDLSLPLIIVAHAGLGTINHSLLTIEAAQARRLSIAGLVLNESRPVDEDESIATNAAEISRRSGVCILGTMRHADPGQPRRIESAVPVDWRALAENSPLDGG